MLTVSSSVWPQGSLCVSLQGGSAGGSASLVPVSSFLPGCVFPKGSESKNVRDIKTDFILVHEQRKPSFPASLWDQVKESVNNNNHRPNNYHNSHEWPLRGLLVPALFYLIFQTFL